MKTYFNQSVIVLILSLAITGWSNPSFAGQYRRKVNYADLNLDQPGDVAVLYARIQKAARLVCRRDMARWDEFVMTHYQQCLQMTVDKAVHDVNQDALTALHRGQMGSIAKH